MTQLSYRSGRSETPLIGETILLGLGAAAKARHA